MKKTALAAAVVIGCFFFYYVWTSLSELPKLGEVDDFSLQEVSGNDFSVSGKPMLVSFFYTKCPDVCPFTIQDLKKLQRALAEKGIEEAQYSILSVTLDPAFDTVPVILQYKEAFDIQSSNWLFLRGTEQQTREYAEQFNMVYEKSEEGVITHSTSMYMVDADGRIRAVHDMASGNKRVDIEKAADHLIQLIE
ncbi:SCO family protein [Domibacillus indicus]|uniref:SCO family protein n=1 Tax=Domibacillus indicus TaxID=1437523 RepID=UPI0020404295|nr:SCO family protein [Domibacillus indicus]MCM3789832.1 SCO family protein [Domibacillus indicus]